MDIPLYWRQCMVSEGLSPITIKDRLAFVARIEREVGSVLQITRQDLIAWTAEKPWSNNTRIHNRSALHTFFTWLQDEGFRQDNPAARLPAGRYQRRIPTPFTIAEIDHLVSSGVYAKTRTMIALYYYIGLRRAEIARVKGEDVDWYERTLSTIGKGNKLAVLPIPDALWDVCIRMPRTGYWFPNRQDNAKFKAYEGHIMEPSVTETLGAAIKRAGLKRRPHDLRAALATELNREKIPTLTVRDAMRHANVNTTSYYTLVDHEQIRDALNQLPRVTMPTKVTRPRAAA